MLRRKALQCRPSVRIRFAHALLHDLAVNRLPAANLGALVYSVKDVTRTSQDLPLRDVTVVIKDNICTVDMPTTCSSAMLAHFKPPYDATAVKLLREAGAPVIGKANCDEFGMG